MSKSIVVVYFSGYGHTHEIAEAVAAGAEARLLRINEFGDLPDGGWDELAGADAIIFGSPTYMGNAAWQFKKFIDESSKVWAAFGWNPGEEVAYVLEGTLEYKLDGRPPITLKAGDALFIPSGNPHSARNVWAGKASELATYIFENGKPLVVLSQ